LGRVLGRVLQRADERRLPLLASALTFDALLALIPLAILVIAGLGYLLDRTEYFGTSDPGQLLRSFLPTQLGRSGGPDTTAVAERLLELIGGYRSRLTWVAIPAFLWFASRLFAGTRVSLSLVLDAPHRKRHHAPALDYLLSYFFAKLRDLRMIGVVLALALVNTMLSAALAVLSAEGIRLAAPWTFFASGLGRILTESVAVGSALVLFTLLYRYASPKRLDWHGAAIAGVVATVGFEVAKRLFGLYLAYIARGGVYSVDANIGAALLFILWIWYMALVFLLGAVAARVWEDDTAARLVAEAEPAAQGGTP
jgi:membrane protein